MMSEFEAIFLSLIYSIAIISANSVMPVAEIQFILNPKQYNWKKIIF